MSKTALKDLEAISREAGVAPEHGHYRMVQYCPDLANGERLNVAVCYESELPTSESFLFRALSSFERIRCAYGDPAIAALGLLLRSVEIDLREGRAPSSPHLVVSDELPASGDSPEEILERAFAYTVPLARPRFEMTDKAPVSVRTKQLRKRVADDIKRKTGHAAERILPQNPQLKYQEGAGWRYLDVPLQGIGKLGTIVSATMMKSESIERSVVLAAEQVRAAAYTRDVKDIGIFMLRPAEGSMPEADLERVDSTIEQLIWMFRKQDIQATGELSVELLSDAVIDWGITTRNRQAHGADRRRSNK